MDQRPRKNLFKKSISFLHDRLWGRFLLGLIIAVFVVLVKKVAIEHQSWYGSVRLASYELTQSVLSRHHRGSGPVTIINIASIPRQHDESVTDQKYGAVSREALKSALKIITSAHPKSIGIDVDFSPEKSGNPVTEKDSDFFKDCRTISAASGVPIYLGVYRNAAKTEPDWLGSEENSVLAAGLQIGNKDFQGDAFRIERPLDRVIRMFCWTKVEEQATGIPTLAFALAKAAKPEIGKPSALFSWLLEARSEFAELPYLETQGFLVDYHLIDSLQQTVVDYENLSNASLEPFAGKVVILGNVKQNIPADAVNDAFRVPGREGKYSGVLLHACAVDTLLESPLMEWTENGGIFADLLVAFFAIGAAEVISAIFHRRKGKESRDSRISWWAVVVMCFALSLISSIFVGWLRLMWDDVAFVALGLIIHTWLEQSMIKQLPHHGKVHEGSKELSPL